MQKFRKKPTPTIRNFVRIRPRNKLDETHYSQAKTNEILNSKYIIGFLIVPDGISPLFSTKSRYSILFLEVFMAVPTLFHVPSVFPLRFRPMFWLVFLSVFSPSFLLTISPLLVCLPSVY